MASSRSLGTLSIDLVANIGGFEQGMDKAERELDKRAKRMNDVAKKIGIGIGTAITAGLAAATTLATGIKLSIDRMDELSKSAQRVSLPTEQFSQLAYAGDLADVSIQDLETSLGRLTKAQAAANNSASQQAKIFDALGISTKNADGSLRSSIDVLYDFADRFKQLEGSPEATAAGMQLFGRSFQNLIPLLKDGSQGLRDAASEADKLGITLSTQAGEQAEEFNDNLTRLSTSVKGLWQEITAAALPGLLSLSEQFVESASNADGATSAAEDLGRAIGDLAVQTGNVIQKFPSFNTELLKLRKAADDTAVAINTGLAQALANLSPSSDFQKRMQDRIRKNLEFLNTSPQDAYKKNNASGKAPTLLAPVTVEGNLGDFAKQEADRLKQAKKLRDAINAAMGPTNNAKSGGGKSDAQREAEQLEAAYQRLMESQQQEIALFGKTTEVAKIRYETEFGDLKNLSDAKKNDLIANAERIDQMQTEAELSKAADEAVRRETEAYKQNQDQLQSVIDDMQFELSLYGLTNKEREKAIALRYASVDAMSEEGQKIAELSDKLYEANQRQQDQIDLMEGARNGARTFFDDLKDGVGIVDSLKDAFGRFADALFDWASNSLIDQFFGKSGTTGQGTAGGGWINALFGSSGSSQGSIIDLFSGGWGFAGGGVMDANSVARVNERGFEMATVGGSDYLLTGARPVKITPHEKLGGRGGSVTQNFYNPVMSNIQTDSQRAAYEARKAQRAIARNG